MMKNVEKINWITPIKNKNLQLQSKFGQNKKVIKITRM